jgi:hypothetical protein
MLFDLSLGSRAIEIGKVCLALACVLLAGSAALELVPTGPKAEDSAQRSGKAVEAPAIVTPQVANISEQVAEILQRPLFTPGRRPPAPPAPPAPPPIVAEAPKPEWGKWRLAGIMSSPGRREALFTQGTDKLAIAEGQQIDGWTVAAIGVDSVTLKSNDVEKRLGPERSPIVAQAPTVARQVGFINRQPPPAAAGAPPAAAASPLALAALAAARQAPSQRPARGVLSFTPKTN